MAVLMLLGAQWASAQCGIEITSPSSATYFGAPSFFSGAFNGESAELVIPVDTSGSPEFGCFEFTNAAEMAGKIALIDRGGCAFDVKAQNAQDAGAIAAIVCTNNPDPAFQMLGSAGITIPVIMLSMADCDLIKVDMPGVEGTFQAPLANQSTISASNITDGTWTAPDLLEGFGTVFSGATHGAWYRYTTASEGLLNINSCDNGSDTRLIVIPGTNGGEVSDNVLAGNYFVSVDACDDGSGNNGASELNLLTYANTTYYIHWDNAQDSTGFDFDVNLGSLPNLDITFSVDMSLETVSNDGVHFVWADPNVGVPLDTLMEDLGDGVWAITLPLTALDTIGYFFSNGLPDNVMNFETVPGECGVDSGIVPGFFVRPLIAGVSPNPGLVCFSSCDPCPPPACANPNAIICDDVEGYNVGDLVSDQATFWEPWPNTVSAEVSDEQAFSGNLSVKVDGGPGDVDQLLLLGDSTSGNYTLKWKFYIPAGNGGYYNFQKIQDDAGGEFGMQIDFQPDGTASLDATAENVVSFSYTQDAWIDIVHFIDLDNDVIRLLVEGNTIFEWQYSATTFSDVPSLKQLGAINFFPLDNSYLFYIDDVEFATVEPQICNPDAIICDGFEWYADQSTTGPQAAYWSTWSGNLGGADDGLVTTEQAADGLNSMLIAEGQTQDVLLLLGNQTEGHYLLRWDMFIPAGKTGYFNVQEDEMPGVQWNLEVYLNRDNNNPGVGELDGLGVTFNYPEGQWFSVVHEIDLDSDLFEMWVDGVFVGALPYTDNVGGINFFSADDDNRYYIDNVELIGLPSCMEDAIICDPIEAYPEGAGVSTQAAFWELWPGAEDGTVTTEQAFSGTNSVLIAEGQLDDILLLLGNQTEGRFELSWQYYIPAGATAYWNIQNEENPGQQWNMDVFFNQDGGAAGTGVIQQTGETFTYPEDQWFQIFMIIDLDNDVLSLDIDGNNVTDSYAYPDNLGSINFFSIDGANRYYIDDVLYRSLPSVMSTIDLTLNVDAELLNDLGILDPTGIWIAGSFNGFVGEPMTDNGDETYSVTLAVEPETTHTYKFQNGEGNWENIDVSQGSDCVTGANNDRFIEVASADVEVDLVCYNYCITCDNVVSTNEAVFQNALSVFPNPAQSSAFVSFAFETATDIEIRMLNNLGQTVSMQSIDGALEGNAQIDLDNVPAGLYMLQVTDGQNQFVEKLIVE